MEKAICLKLSFCSLNQCSNSLLICPLLCKVLYTLGAYIARAWEHLKRRIFCQSLRESGLERFASMKHRKRWERHPRTEIQLAMTEGQARIRFLELLCTCQGFPDALRKGLAVTIVRTFSAYPLGSLRCQEGYPGVCHLGGLVKSTANTRDLLQGILG